MGSQSEGAKWGSKAIERGDGVGGGGGGREIFEKCCIKNKFSCTINAIIRGSLCTGIDQFPILLFFLFPFFFTRRSTGGGGGMAPLCPLSYASGQWFRIFKNLCVSNTNLGLNPLVFDVDFKLILIIILVALTLAYPCPRIIAQSDSWIELNWIEFICFLRSAKLQLKQNINGIQRIQDKVNNKNWYRLLMANINV